ncbi:MAG TPA: site-specific integrase [Bacteriovoracaceae bacterium]|nr:site-specific integrase [Bacteriovoracaceae bacterium]
MSLSLGPRVYGPASKKNQQKMWVKLRLELIQITKYYEGEQEFWRVYVHIRSKTNRHRRVQKYAHHLESEAEARREEKKLIRDASFEVQKIDGLGLDWNDVVNLWWAEVKAGYLGKITERSAESYMSIIHKWTVHWMKRPAAEIGRADGRILIQKLEAAGLSKTYQKKVKNIINKVYEWGIEFRYIIGADRSPLKGLVLSVSEEKAPDILILEEIKKFLSVAQAVNHYWYPIWAFAILTGMRSGELHALTWDQIDLEKNLIMVDRSYDSNSYTVGSTKARYWRTVPINSSLRKLLVDLKNGPQNSMKSNETEDRAKHVLPRSKDWDNGDQAVPLKNFLRSIKMRPIKFHALRACFATQMLANGVAAPIVMKIGGWKKTSTMDIYLRLAGVDTRGATDCLQFVPDEIAFGDNVVSIFNKTDGA